MLKMITEYYGFGGKLKTLLFMGLLLTSFSTIEQRAQAIINNSANIPGEIQSYSNDAIDVWNNYRCRNINDGIDFVSKMQGWISPLGRPQVIEPIVISEGTNIIEMQHNILATHCALNIDTFGSAFAGDPTAAPNANSTLINATQFGTTSANIGYVTADIPGVGYLNDTSIRWGVGYGSTNTPPPYSYSTRMDIDIGNTINCDSNPINQRFYAKSSCALDSVPVNIPIRIVNDGIRDLKANADGTSRTYNIQIVLFSIAVTEFGPTHPTAPNTLSCVTNRVPASSLSDTTNCGGSPVFADVLLRVNAVDQCDNISGYQESIPDGYVRSGVNDCVIPDPPDAPDISCPSYPDYASFTNPNVVINLSNAGKPANETVPSAPPPSSWTGSLIQDTRDDGGLTAVRQVRDTSTDNIVRTYGYSTELPIAQLAPIANPVRDQYGQAPNYDATDAGDGTLKTDYTPFLDYPYDVHTAEATYQRKVFTRFNSYTYTRVRTYNYERATTSDPWIQVSAGNNGWSSSRASYTDSNPYWGAYATATATVEMPPCYPRDFSAALDNLNASLTTDRESPTGSSFSFTIPTTLSYSNGGSLRTATTVTALPYTVSWFTSGYNETAGSPSYSGSFSRTVNITNTSRSNNVIGSSGTLNETITVNIPPNSLPGAQAIIEAGQEICWVVEVGRPTGTVGIGGAILTSNTPAVSDDTCTAPAIDQPYSRFYGADVFAGGGFNGIDDTCSATDPDASLVGAMRGTGITSFSGTGTQLAAFALGLITNVQPLSQSNRTPTQLAFANSGGATVNVGSRQFGGGFGSVVCANDYFADIPDSATWDSTTGNINVGNLSSGRHYYDGDVNIYGLVPEDLDVDGFGRRIVIYVDGDVSLRQNQTGDGTGRVGFVNNTDWPSIEAIPSLYIISNGNILIDDGVNEIDGVLIAQGGEIDTCSLGTTRLFTTSPDTTEATELSVNCRTQLRVNGAFLANKVNLLRTLGSLRESVPGEGPDATRAAETFIYNPTLWFTNGGELIPNKKMQIDSYTSLPPSL